MGNKVFFRILLAAVVVLLAVVVVGAFERPDRDNDIVAYNVLAERMFEGTAASKGRVIEGLMYFPLKTANTLVEVQIGPKEFVERNNFKLRSGDMVTVIGMPVVIKDRDVVLARQVSGMNGALTIRDPMGLPLWDKTDRPPHYTLLTAAEHVRYDHSR
jgi:hypothetical protein